VCPPQGLLDVGCPLAVEADTRRVIPDRASHCSVRIECLVDDVPGPDLAGVVLGEDRDVIPQDLVQSRDEVFVVLYARHEPFGNLLVPDEAMPGDLPIV